MNKMWLLTPISISAFIATWGGWAKLSTLTGFDDVEMIPGQPWSRLNIGMVLPMGVDAYGALAMAVAFDIGVQRWARWFAGVTAVVTLTLSGIAQAVVHNLTVAGATRAPEQIVSFVSILPVVVLGLGGALAMAAAAKVSQDISQAPARKSSQWAGMLGRVGEAATGRLVSQLGNRPVPETIPAGTAPASQARDDIPGRWDAPLGMPVPVSPAPAGMRVPAGPRVRPSGLTVARSAALDKDPEVLGQVLGWLQEHPQPTVAELAQRLGTSQSSAGRVRVAAAKRLREGIAA